MRERGQRPGEPSAPKPDMSELEPRPVPIDWMALDDEARAEILVGVLFEWVPKIVVEFEFKDTVVPPCWYLHSAMIHELLALYQYRQQQQFNEAYGPPASAGIDFQYQFSLWRGRMEILRANTSCTVNEHRPLAPPSWADPESPTSAKWHVDAEDHVRALIAKSHTDTVIFPTQELGNAS